MGLFPSWRPVRVPALPLYPRLEECLQTAWKALTGETLTKSTAMVLRASDRPGDVGEMERLLVEAASRGPDFLAQRLGFPGTGKEEKSYWKNRKRQLERSLVQEALRKTNGNQAEAARVLGLHRNTLLWHLSRIRGKKA
jgi:transcriptional regulator with GAF, ATPase, and Fis domain